MTARKRFTSMSCSNFSGSLTGLNWPDSDSTMFWNVLVNYLHSNLYSNSVLCAGTHDLPLAMLEHRELVPANAQHREHHAANCHSDSVNVLCIRDNCVRHMCTPTANIDAKCRRSTYSSPPLVHRNSMNWQKSAHRPYSPNAAEMIQPLRVAYLVLAPTHLIPTAILIEELFKWKIIIEPMSR